MGQIESIDDLKSALKVDDLRKMSSDKVLDLVQMIQNDQISSGVLSALLTVAPDTVAKLAQAMDDSVQQAVTSNEKVLEISTQALLLLRNCLRKLSETPKVARKPNRMRSTALNGTTTNCSSMILTIRDSI